MLKVRRSTCNEFVYGELGRFPLAVERKYRLVKYWLKIVGRESSLLVLSSYNTLFNTVGENRDVNWVYCVKNLLCELGFAGVWHAQGVANRTQFLKQCKQRLQDQYIQQWYGGLRVRTSCLLYREIKQEFGISEYLKCVKCLKWRVALTRFLTRNHSLPNVTMGQGHNRVPYNQRLCTECGVLGDEYHCFFECRKTEHLRHFLPEFYKRRPSMEKFTLLLTSPRVPLLNKVAKFVYLAGL